MSNDDELPLVGRVGMRVDDPENELFREFFAKPPFFRRFGGALVALAGVGVSVLWGAIWFKQQKFSSPGAAQFAFWMYVVPGVIAGAGIAAVIAAVITAVAREKGERLRFFLSSAVCAMLTASVWLGLNILPRSHVEESKLGMVEVTIIGWPSPIFRAQSPSADVLENSWSPDALMGNGLMGLVAAFVAGGTAEFVARHLKRREGK